MVSRLGSVELGNIVQYKLYQHGFTHELDKTQLKLLVFNAGFFPAPNKTELERFVSTYCDSFRYVDVLGIWGNLGEDYMITQYGKKDIVLSSLGNLEPWNAVDIPWSVGLKGKKVLFIHPFKDTIEMQLSKREMIYPNMEILPQMDVSVLRAVQTIAGNSDRRFQDWFEALDYMHQRTREYDYDVAIIGCGAYGLPLAAKIKDDGKQAIHLGGATQLFWGIRGGRWDTRPEFQRLFNDAWVRPLESDRVENCMSVENGCYW